MDDGPALWEGAVTYGAVGVTSAPDLMRHPPDGYRPFEVRRRIGHGDERWEFACTELLTWGLQRRSGLRVEVAPSPETVTGTGYKPVEFDPQGEPVKPAATESEATFSAKGEPFLRPGDSARLLAGFGFVRLPAPVRVIYVIEESDRCGFAYGTLPGHPESGEEAFVLERTDDGSVWLTIRSISRPSSWPWWVLYPALRLAQAIATRRYLRALARPIGKS